ncbi:hypothetical protein D3C81_1315780 [compost metagenome]
MARNRVLAPPSSRSLRARRYSSTRVASSLSASSGANRRPLASAASAVCASAAASSAAFSAAPAGRLGCGSMAKALPLASRSSSAAGSGVSSGMATLLSRRLSSGLRRDRSSRRRCHCSSRPPGPAGSSSLSAAATAASSGASSTCGSAGGSAAVASSGRICAARAWAMSRTSTKRASSWRRCWATRIASLNGVPLPSRPLSNSSTSRSCTRLRRVSASSLQMRGKKPSAPSHRPA